MKNAKLKISIVGGGTVGKTLGRLFHNAGYLIRSVFCRTQEKACEAVRFIQDGTPVWNIHNIDNSSDIYLISTKDDVIDSVARDLVVKCNPRENAILIHTSGAKPSTVLSIAHQHTLKIASIHPLNTFSSCERAVESFKGTFCFYEGDEEIHFILEQLIKEIGGIPAKIKPEMKTLYHCAAVFSCNYLYTLADTALKLFDTIGIDRKTAQESLFPLLYGTLLNIKNIGLPSALTGPVSRNDRETLKEHIRLLRKNAPHFIKLYNTLGLYTVEVALEKGTITKTEATSLRHLFLMEETKIPQPKKKRGELRIEK